MKIKHSFLLILMLIINTLFSQVDTSDVFIIGGSDTKIVDTVIQQKAIIKSSFKYEIARLALGEITFSFEKGSKDLKSSFEPEATLFWLGQGFYFLDYFTNNKIDNLSFFTPSPNLGIGLTYKRYISKKKAPLFGPYLAVKLRNRFAKLSQEVEDKILSNFSQNILNPVIGNPQHTGLFSFNGYFNMVELSLLIGNSIWKRDWFHMDVYIGPSLSFSNFKYGKHKQTDFHHTWEEKKGSTLLPSINFGFRIGIADRFFKSKINFNRHNRF